ncbi:MAG: hypothetical protein KHZ87_05250 [Clostridiales bacterium]|nr:hypothetical protein [Clostridiales bacterium]MBS5878259.1 hypothetical protein [Clostridiales bacterium]MDU0939584.1 hypothetical protein [Clostridiales bacterium]MDU1041434.1 hypothetical protein [Clostridiales bacterium]MDU3490854.1 hypothetical protein [Clostridiales bacterium]
MKKLKNEWKVCLVLGGVFLSIAAFRTEMIHAEEYEDNITVGGEERSYGNNADHRANALADAYDQLKKAYKEVLETLKSDTAYTEYYYQPYPIEITYDSHERWMPETHYYYSTWNTYR